MTATPSESLFSKAQWIASPICGGPRTSAPCPFLRKSFALSKPIRSAQLAITALGLYECHINGKRVGDQVFAPGWTDYSKRVPYQIHDVSALLLPGENAIGAILGDGWYCGYVGWIARQNYGDRPQLLAQLQITFADGTTETIATDNTWHFATGPILDSDLLSGESYDARKELGAWSKPKYAEQSGVWSQVQTVSAPLIELSPQLGPPVRRIQELKPVSIHEIDCWPQINTVADFGQNFSGRMRITVKASAGTTLTLRYGEVVNPNGTVYTENLRSVRATDYYTCRSNEEETWEPRFTFHGFRHASINGPKSAKIIEMTAIVLHSDTPPTGEFQCSNPLINKLQKNIQWGQRSNFLEVPTDCPQRDERLGWTGDAQVFVRTAAFNMDVRTFFHKWLRDIRDAQRPNGAIPSVIPSIVMDIEDGGPAWADAGIICPWTIYRCYGDQSIIENQYESMDRFMQFIAKHRCQPGDYIRGAREIDPWGGFGDWLALDGSGKTEGGTPRDLIGTAFYAYDASIMEKTAMILGRKSDAKKYRDLHEHIVKAFQHRFVTPSGLIAAGTQTAYVLALHFGLIPEPLRRSAASELALDVEKRGFHLATGFVGTPYLLDVLEDNGYLDLAYKLLEQETFPSWLFPVKNGATTIWERWDGWTPEKGFQDKGMNSFNHYAYGAVGAWMVRSVAGLDLHPEIPGYNHILFRPRPGGSITWAEAKLETEHGKVSIHWKQSDHQLDITLCVPKGTKATLQPPAGYNAKDQELNPGEHHIVLKKS